MFLVILAVLLPGSCLLSPPTDGAVVREFAPDGLYGGHWGVDIGADVASPVRSAAAGVVTFSGVVAGNETVTVYHGGGLRTSYSYLIVRRVVSGQVVEGGALLGLSGRAHGVSALHWSLRFEDRYLDPAGACRSPGAVSMALRLAPTPASYPVSRAPRPPWRDIRSAPPRPPDRR